MGFVCSRVLVLVGGRLLYNEIGLIPSAKAGGDVGIVAAMCCLPGVDGGVGVVEKGNMLADTGEVHPGVEGGDMPKEVMPPLSGERVAIPKSPKLTKKSPSVTAMSCHGLVAGTVDNCAGDELERKSRSVDPGTGCDDE